MRQLVRNTGEVFDALSERDGQLASLITNSNRVFATTARAQPGPRRPTFRALPTFEQESQHDAQAPDEVLGEREPGRHRAAPGGQAAQPDARAALGGSRPTSRRCSATSTRWSTRPRRACRRRREFLDQLHPLLAEFDGPLRQLNPILDGAGLYKNELDRVLRQHGGGDAGDDGRSAAGEPAHYLRTSNPLNPEMLAQYPKRLSTNRTNPYPFPGDVLSLKDGLASFETRQCTRPDADAARSARRSPGVLSRHAARRHPEVRAQQRQRRAPPCKQQARFNLGGTLTQFPQLQADVKGAAAAAAPSAGAARRTASAA